MLRTAAFVILLFFGVPATASAQSPPTAAALRAGLAGEWSGFLGYRDYQSDELFELPVRTSIEALADGVTTIRRSVYDDGPSGAVLITALAIDDPAAGTVATATARKGRALESQTEAVRVAAYAAPTRWTLIYTQVGEDDDAPAEIRITEVRDGDSVRTLKQVRPVGGADAAWKRRNESRLTRRP